MFPFTDFYERFNFLSPVLRGSVVSYVILLKCAREIGARPAKIDLPARARHFTAVLFPTGL